MLKFNAFCVLCALLVIFCKVLQFLKKRGFRMYHLSKNPKFSMLCYTLKAVFFSSVTNSPELCYQKQKIWQERPRSISAFIVSQQQLLPTFLGLQERNLCLGCTKSRNFVLPEHKIGHHTKQAIVPLILRLQERILSEKY